MGEVTVPEAVGAGSRTIAGVPLRRRLLLLTAAGILPLAVMAGVGLYVLERQQNEQAERIGLELSRSVANAIDAELRRATSVLETLATTSTLDRFDLAGFREDARRVLDREFHWAGVLLADRDGDLVVDTRAAPGVTLSEIAESESFQRVIRDRKPAVGDLTLHENAWLFAVRAPVIRGSNLQYVVTALVRPEAIRDALRRQAVPSDWVISIVDSQGLRVARSRAHDETLGGRLSETVQQVVAQSGAEGFGVAYTLEGERIFTPYSRLASSGWMAVLGIPTALVDVAAFHSLEVFGGGILLSIVLGGIAALWAARTIAKPIGELRATAVALGRRKPLKPMKTSILEIREVDAALRTAGEELARGEQVRDELLRKERQAREAAEAADRAKEEFMAVLSHELRTPLNAVSGWARLLQKDQLRDEAVIARAKDAIVRNADIQVQLIDDLLDLSRIASGKMRLDVRPVDLLAVLQAAFEVVRQAADAKGVALHAALAPQPDPIAGDAGRLQQVVWNLLMNAVKFTPKGGEVRLELRPGKERAQIVVSDTGQGIAPDMLPHIFERFRQADTSSTRAHGGLGLGLALVQNLVELHGGSVAAQSGGQGLGATFIVTLPVAKAGDSTDKTPRTRPSIPIAETSAPMSGIVRLDGLRILVVDDETDALVLAQTILTSAGADVRTCSSAPEAFRILRRWPPDVLVSDIEMPGEDGYSLVQKVRALPADEAGRVPAIALSAYGRPQDRQRAIAAGFSMHVPKPVDPGELTAIVAGVAGRPTQPQEI